MSFQSWTGRRLVMTVAGAALLGGSGVAMATSVLHHPASVKRASAAKLVVRPAPDQYNPATPRPAVPAPIRILIPNLGVDAAVEPVGVTADLDMATPTQTDATGWYAQGSAPGKPGDAVLDGHLDTQTGAPAVFARLAQARPGDQITIALADGTQAHFAVTGLSSTGYRSRPPGLFSTDGPARLTLITCSGPWDPAHGVYSERLVVEASTSTN